MRERDRIREQAQHRAVELVVRRERRDEDPVDRRQGPEQHDRQRRHHEGGLEPRSARHRLTPGSAACVG